jgi:Protein of unknown function (DUF4230)
MRRLVIWSAVGVVVFLTVALLLLLPKLVPSLLFQRHEETVDVSSVVTRVRELSRLETAAMHVVNVTTANQSYQMVPDALGGDSLTFLAAGDVIAGIDLSHITEKDVQLSPGGLITLRLPPPEILVSRLDNRESRVLNRKTGMLRSADLQLESRVREHAEMAIRTEAMKKGILPLATQNGEQKLGSFLLTLGFKKVRFVKTPAPEAVATPGRG